MDKLWEPTNYRSSNLFKFESFLSENYNLKFDKYSEMHAWSVDKLEKFWLAVSEFFVVEFSKKY